jgi:hypothetical protein
MLAIRLSIVGVVCWTHMVDKAAWTADKRILTAMSGLRARTAASKGTRLRFSQGTRERGRAFHLDE